MRRIRFALLLLSSLSATVCGIAQQTAAATSSTRAVTIPRGTVVLLTLVSPIKSVSTGVGGTVRALVAFPITDQTQLAIPAGTYVEGEVLSLSASDKTTHQPAATIHFTRLLYANGYTVALDAVNSAALQMSPALVEPSRSKTDPLQAEYAAVEDTPHPHSGPSAEDSDTFNDATLPIGGMNLSLFHHKKKPPPDVVLFQANFQFQMTLASDLSLDPAQVDAAAAIRPR